MADRLNIITPEATTNLITNPSFETNTTGWTAVGGATALAQSSGYQRRGVWSLAVTPDSGTTDGVYCTISAVTTNTDHAYGFDFRGVDSIPYTAYLYDIGISSVLGTPITFTGDGEWHRYTGTASTSTGAVIRLYITKNNSADTDVFYVDGVQVEQKAYATTYCDGDQLGNALPLAGNIPPYRWNGTQHASTSTRSAYTTSGGRIRDIEALNTTYPILFLGIDGAGMAPSRHNVQDYALLAGAELQSVKVDPRVLTLRLQTDVDGADMNPGNYTARDELEKILTHDRVSPLQPVVLEWEDTGHRIEAYYDTGLQAAWTAGCANEVITARMVAYRPWWYADGQEALHLQGTGFGVTGVQQTRLNSGRGMARINGTWQALGTGFNGPVFVIASDPQNPNLIYFGGQFTTVNGAAHNNAVVYNVAEGTFSAIGSGFNQRVTAILPHPNGSVYFGGFFTQANGVAHNYCVEYTPSTGVFTAMDVGVNSLVYALEMEPTTGDVYVGGGFTQAGGAAANYIASWDISADAWVTLGTSPDDGVGSTVYALEMGIDGKLYVGGAFTALGSGPTSRRIATWDNAVPDWTAFTTGLDNDVYSIIAYPNGDMYLAGSFVNTSPIGDTMNYIARYDGAQFTSLGVGLDADAYSLTRGPDGTLWVGGAFTGAGDTDAEVFALWNGSTWARADADFYTLGAGVYINAIHITAFGDLFVGIVNAVGTSVPASNVVTVTNSGSSPAYPIIELTGPGRFTWIENQTTGDRLYMDMEVLAGETVTLNLDPQAQSITSNFGANRNSGILPGSNFASFRLLPGSNTIAVFCDGATAATTLDMYWTILHQSADGGVS